MKLIIDIPKNAYDLLQGEGVDWLGAEHILDVVAKGKPVEECEDCVSRQAAINVAVDAVDDWDGGCNKTREEYIRKALETIPPAIPAEKPNKWIPVSERLPEDRQKVLLTVGNIFYVDDTYNTVEIYWYIKDKNAFVNRDNEVAAKPIAWMPSPETYKASPTGAETE